MVETQLKQVRRHLYTHGNITSWDAIVNYKITRLSDLIFKLRRAGHCITMTRIQTIENKWYGLYKLCNNDIQP